MAAYPKQSQAVGLKVSTHRFQSAVRLLVWLALPACAHGDGFLCDNYNCSDYTQTTMAMCARTRLLTRLIVFFAHDLPLRCKQSDSSIGVWTEPRALVARILGYMRRPFRRVSGTLPDDIALFSVLTEM
eukprot:1851397-Pleurochrysis_carterae.AAC.1